MRLTDEQRAELDQMVIDTIWAAELVREPLEVLRGPGFDIRLRNALRLEGLRVHQTEICTALKRVIERGRVFVTDSDELYVASYCGDREYYHPMATFYTAV